MIRPPKFRGAHVHLIDPRDGVVGRRLLCVRCYRDMPEDQFTYLGPHNRAVGRRRVVALHPYCATCRKQRAGQWVRHEMYSPALDRFWDGAFATLKAGAVRRGILVAVEKEDLLGLYLAQAGRCAITGMEMDWKTLGGSARGHSAARRPSVDRINSQANYTADNIQIVCLTVNRMKNDMSMTTFVEMCRRVAKHADQQREAEANVA